MDSLAFAIRFSPGLWQKLASRWGRGCEWAGIQDSPCLHAGGSVKLANLTQKVGDLLQVTKLVTVFDVYENGGHV